MDDFRRKVLKLNESRVHKVKASNGVYDAYKWIRKHKWVNIGKPLKEHEFYSVIRKVNKYFAEELINGNDVTLPCHMGRLELRKIMSRTEIKDGKLKTNLPVDWDKTLRLWHTDSKSFNDRTLVRAEEKQVFKIYYNRQKGNFNNKSFYEFIINRDIKK